MRYTLGSLFLIAFSVSMLAEDQPAPKPAQEGPGFAERDPRYRIQSSDILEVQYRYTPEYNSTVTVQPDGFVTLQLVGDVKVAGLNLEQASSAIRTKAAVHLNDPVVVVLLKEFVKPHFVVAGEVNHPGRFDLRGNVTAVEAIAIGGGFKDSSKHSQVVLVRRVSTELAEVRVMDMKKMMSGKGNGIREDIAIMSGDLLVVPQNTLSKMERYIRWGNLGALGISVAVR